MHAADAHVHVRYHGTVSILLANIDHRSDSIDRSSIDIEVLNFDRYVDMHVLQLISITSSRNGCLKHLLRTEMVIDFELKLQRVKSNQFYFCTAVHAPGILLRYLGRARPAQ